MVKKFNIIFWRRISQAVFGVLLTNSYFQVITTKIGYDGPLKGACVPFLNCHACPFAVFSCPIGMLQHSMAIQRLPLYLIGFFVTIGLIFGRAACGWLCPFGLLQDFIYKIKSKKFGIPKFLNYGKYVVLIFLVLLIPYLTGVHWFSKLCPYGALIAGIPWVAWNPVDPDFGEPVISSDAIGTMFIIKMIILVLFLIWFILAKRPFCRTVCPMGAIWGVFNRISLLKSKVKDTCKNCNQCPDICPMDLNVNEEVDSENCIKCLDCSTCKHIEAGFRV